MSDFHEALEAALAGGPQRHHEKTAEQGKLPVRERVERLVDPGSFAEEGLLANWDEEGLGADGVVTGLADDRRPPRRADGQRPDRQGRLLGPEDGREDPPHPGTGAGPPGADGLPGRLGRGADHRPGADVPRPPRRRPHLPQRGAPLRPGAAGLPALRPERRRRRLHPGLLRRRDHARRQRLDVPGLAADGGDGDRRDGDAGGDGRREDAHRRLRLRPLPGQERRGGDRPRPALPLLHAGQLARGAARRRRPPRPPPSSRSPRSSPPTRTGPSTCSELLDSLLDADSFLAGPQALGEGADRRLRPPRRPRRSASSPTSPSTTAASSSSTPPTRRPASSRPATPSTCRCSSSPTCPAS